jgi:metal-responsive CopG/Arc/MetJ family transcriptional regulator
MEDTDDATISVRIKRDLLDKIEKRAENYGVSRAMVIRQLIEEGMKAHIKLLPSASALEREITSLNKKIDRIAEAIHEYQSEERKPSEKTRHVD